MAVLTSLRIFLNFEGVTDEIGKYPFAKILIADVYMHSWVINSLYNIMVNLWSNEVNLVNLHKVI